MSEKFEVGDEVVSVKDDDSGGEFFRKGDRGKIIAIENDDVPYFVEWEYAPESRQLISNRWWSTADKLEAA